MTTLQPTWFVDGDEGEWRVEALQSVVGEALPACARLGVYGAEAAGAVPRAAAVETCRWTLRGTTGHVRYVERDEKRALAAITPPLARAEATCAAFIPIRKSQAWWELAQDERRAILASPSV